MKNILLCAFAAALIFAWTQDGVAEVYSYRDKNGVMVFSDSPPDASQAAPADVEVTKETVSIPGDTLAPEAPGKGVNKAAGKPGAKAPGKKEEKGPTEAEIQAYIEGLKQLHKEAQDMQDEKDALQKEVDELLEQGKKIRKRSAMRVHNSRVREVNEKIKALADQAKEHDQRLRDYEDEHADVREAAAKRDDSQ